MHWLIMYYTNIWIICKINHINFHTTQDKLVEAVCIYNDQKSFLQKVLFEDQNVKI
jgi:hypothetical protein